MKWQPKDVVAIIGLIIGGTLLLKGIDTVVGWSLIVINAGYFGIDLTPLIKLGRKQKDRGGD